MSQLERKEIKRSDSGWVPVISGNRVSGQVILTNEDLTLGKKVFKLNEIRDVRIETRAIDTTRIKIVLKRGKPVTLEFGNSNRGHLINVLAMDSGVSGSEINAYHAYWASILTMSIHLYGTEVDETKLTTDISVWCWTCKDMVIVEKGEKPINLTPCPVCNKYSLNQRSSL